MGKYVFQKDVIYEGAFANNSLNGLGKLIMPEGIYEG